MLRNLLVVVLVSFWGAASAAPVVFFMTKKEMEHEGIIKPVFKPTLDFSCNDKIYAVFNTEKIDGGVFTFQWFTPPNPERKLEKEEIEDGAKDWIWSWISYESSSFTPNIEPNAGLEKFVGVWTLKVFYEQNIILEKRFTVLC